MIIVGITGGIASGKTTVVNFLKKKRFAIHDSDSVIKKIYSNPTPSLIKQLKKMNLSNAIQIKNYNLKKSPKINKINKKIIREEIFSNIKKRKLLESYLHAKTKKSRNDFLKKHKQKKTQIVFLDIPLLFENKLEKICNYTILLYAPLKTRKQRAIKRSGMQKKILEKIIKTQLNDTTKKTKADFLINTSFSKEKCFEKLLKTIELIKYQNNA